MSSRGGPGSAGSGSSGNGMIRQQQSPAPSSSTRDGKLPLPDDYFRTPKLNEKETKYLVNLAKRACKEVVYYSRRTGGPMNWVHLSSDDGVEVFQGIDETVTDASARTITYLRGSTRIYATIDDIADFFKLDTPMKLSGFTQTVGKDLLDQKTLYNLAQPTEDNPKHYVGVKWTAVESPSKLARNRDFCYLECHDEFIDTNSKKRGWVRSLHSIRLPFCPPLNTSHGLVRASLYRSGFVFIESDDKSYVDAVHTLHMDIKGNAPNWLKILVMKRRIKNISEVNRYFQMRRLCEGRLLGDLELPAKGNVSNCQICHHKFGLFSRKSACRKCGRVICSNCGHHFILDYVGVGAKKVKVCVQCSDKVTHGGDGGFYNRPESHLGGHRLESVTQHIYDSPTSASSHKKLKDRQRSIEEQEYYRNNEDARGLADIQDAQRMHREFEEHMSRSTGGRPPIVLDNVAPQPIPVKPQTSTVGPSSRRRDQDSFKSTGTVPQPPSSSKRPQPKSAYHEFMSQERSRNTSRVTAPTPVPPAVTSSRVDPLRSSRLPPSAPGEMLSRARQTQGFEPLPIFPNQQTSQVSHRQLDSIRISSDWSQHELPPYQPLPHRLHANDSFFSDDTVGAPIRRSDLSITSVDRMSTADMMRPSVSSQDVFPEEISYQGLGFPPPDSSTGPIDDIPVFPPRRASRAPPVSASVSSASASHQSSSSSSAYDFEQFRRSYFDARNSDIATLEEHVQGQASTTDDEGDFRYGYDDSVSAVSDDAYTDREYEVSTTGARSRRPQPEAAPKSSEKTTSELAMVMALSAMRLYEKENGADLSVSEETRQAALKKMVEIYTNEIERTSSEDLRSRALAERSISEGAASKPLSSRGGSGERQRAQTVVAEGPDNMMEYRDLSDLSASAFRAFQKGTLNEDGTSQPRSDAEPSLPSPATGRSRRPPSGAASKASSSRRNAQLGTTGTDDDRSRGGATNGSLADSDHGKRPLDDDAASDTFSELDLIDLPHLMRADANGDRALDRLSQESQLTTFSDVSTWQEPTRATTSESVPPQSLPQPLPVSVAYDRESDNYTREWASSMSHSYSVGPGVPHVQSVLAGDAKQPAAPPSVATPATSSTYEQASVEDGEGESDLSDEYDEGDLTSRSKMTLSELERYRASLAELMAEYNQEHNYSFGPGQRPPRQPEGEPEAAAARKTRPANGQAPADLEHVLQELYL